MKQNQFEFKPFDQVLVRDTDDELWYPAHYKYYNPKDEKYPHVCDTLGWKQCIPYNDETKHLAHTTTPYKPKQKEPIYEVTFGFGEKLTKWSYTEKDFKEFISIAVCNNKDIKNFSVNVIIPD